jgi:hypothetical protein
VRVSCSSSAARSRSRSTGEYPRYTQVVRVRVFVTCASCDSFSGSVRALSWSQGRPTGRQVIEKCNSRDVMFGDERRRSRFLPTACTRQV